MVSRPSNDDVTRLLRAWKLGDDVALEELLPFVYSELHRLAHHYISGERKNHLLQTTALVNEAFLRLVDLDRIQWKNRRQFFGLAARLMRQILVDFARERQAQKRGGEARQVTFTDQLPAKPARLVELLALDEALRQLEELDERKARVVELRYFAGCGIAETAEFLDVSPETVHRDWKFARTWLYRRLSN